MWEGDFSVSSPLTSVGRLRSVEVGFAADGFVHLDWPDRSSKNRTKRALEPRARDARF